jgi:hypothetical protein
MKRIGLLGGMSWESTAELPGYGISFERTRHADRGGRRNGRRDDRGDRREGREGRRDNRGISR